MINLGLLNRRMEDGDCGNVAVRIYVSFDYQLPSLFLDGAKITGLWGAFSAQADQE
jgi:hypothetical protein